MRRGARVGVDVGSVRVGVARSDPDGLLATPEATLARDPDGDRDRAVLAALVRELDAFEVVVGLPVGMDGREGAAAAAARSFAAALVPLVAPVPVRLVDERLSTVEATRGLREAGRRSKGARSVVDQAAAVVILQHALDAERGSGRPPGVVVESSPPPTGAARPHRHEDP